MEISFSSVGRTGDFGAEGMGLDHSSGCCSCIDNSIILGQVWLHMYSTCISILKKGNQKFLGSMYTAVKKNYVFRDIY